MANDNPIILDGFATDENSLTEDIPALLSSLGWSLTNSKINGKQLNTIFNQIFGYLNFLQSKGLSFWQNDKPYVATASYIDIVRRGNKIYFAKQDSNPDPVNNPAPKAPESNPDYWGVLLDLDNPIHEALSNYALANHNHNSVYALLAGSATQKFKVADGVADDEAISKSQFDSAIQIFLSDNGKSLTANGYQILSNGLIIQWGECDEGSNTFPITFPNQCFSCVATFSNVTTAAAGNTISINSASSFTYQFGGPGDNQHAYFLAIGY